MYKIIKIQASYKIQYKEGHNNQSLQTLALALDNKLALDKVYTRKEPIGYILTVCRDIQ